MHSWLLSFHRLPSGVFPESALLAMFCGPGQALCRCPCSVKAPWTVISSFPSTERGGDVHRENGHGKSLRAAGFDSRGVTCQVMRVLIHSKFPQDAEFDEQAPRR